MKAERKKEIRALVHTVPMLIKAHMVNQALDTEKVIAATFELSEPFLELIGGKIPPNHIDRIQEIYSDLLYKAFNVGIKSGEVKGKSTELNTNLTGSDLTHEIDIKMPMYFGIKRDIILLFRDQLGEILDIVPEIKENIISQFEKDLESSYNDGVKEYFDINNGETEEEEEPLSLEEGVEEVEEVEEVEPEEMQDDDIELDELADDVDLEEEELEDESEEEELVEDEELEDEIESEEEEENVKPGQMVSSLDATAVTALKVWNKFASSDLKKLFNAYSELDQHEQNAVMVHDFNNWLVGGNKAELFIPFEQTNKKPEDRAVIQRLEKYTKLLKDSTAEKVLRYTLGLPVSKKSQAAVTAKKGDPKEQRPKGENENEPKKEEDSSTISKLEAYTKLLNDPVAEKVLRYRLGLPIKKSTASVDKKLIGPYNTNLLRAKILNTIKNPTMSNTIEADASDGVKTIIVDCLVAGLQNIPEAVVVRRINKKLDINATTFAEVELKADALAQALDDELQLEGDCVFVDIDGDYCLTFSYASTNGVVKNKKSKLPNNPQGVLTEQDQRQIECLSQLSKSKTIRDISKASSKVAGYMKKVINDIRFGRMGVVEGGSKLKASLEDVVAEVFGLDGLGYYQYLKDKR